MVKLLPTSKEHIHRLWIHAHTKNEIFILHMLKHYKKIVPTIFIKQIIMDSYTNEKRDVYLTDVNALHDIGCKSQLCSSNSNQHHHMYDMVRPAKIKIKMVFCEQFYM